MRAIKGVQLVLGDGFAVYLVLLALLAAAVVSAEDANDLADIGRDVKQAGSLTNRALSVVAGVKAMPQTRTLSRAS